MHNISIMAVVKKEKLCVQKEEKKKLEMKIVLELWRGVGAASPHIFHLVVVCGSFFSHFHFHFHLKCIEFSSNHFKCSNNGIKISPKPNA